MNRKIYNQHRKSIKREATSMSLNYEKAYEFLTKAYKAHIEGKITEAIKYYKLSISIHPTAEAHTFLGWAYGMQNKYEDAIKECKIAIQINPDFGVPYNDIGAYLISLNKLNEAIYWLEQSLQKQNFPNRHFAYFNLGKIFERKGDWVKAKSYYEKAIELNNQYEAAKDALIRLEALLN